MRPSSVRLQVVRVRTKTVLYASGAHSGGLRLRHLQVWHTTPLAQRDKCPSLAALLDARDRRSRLATRYARRHHCVGVRSASWSSVSLGELTDAQDTDGGSTFRAPTACASTSWADEDTHPLDPLKKKRLTVGRYSYPGLSTRGIEIHNSWAL